MTQMTELTCNCGRLRLAAERAPIVSAECHCDSCRAAAARLQDLLGAHGILEANGGTRFVLYRKDRVCVAKGAELLKEFRLAPDAKTRRVVAACCNTPIFLEFEHGHWLNLYGRLWPEGALPPISERTMTSDLADRSALPSDVPNAKRQSAAFFARLIGAWIAMGFKTPKITFVNGAIRA